MSRTRVKICGITRREDARAAVRAGADAIGLVFHPDSPRAVDLGSAAGVVAGLPAFVTAVGLFVDAPADLVKQACTELPLGLLQFHGSESADYCASFGLPWMKAIRVAPDTDIGAEADTYRSASAILLDTYKAGVPGGTGESFDWERVPPKLDLPVVLAGGLTPKNVGVAVSVARPFAVDVSGGVEEAPGIKSHALIEEFMAAVNAADNPVTAVNEKTA